MRTRYLRGHRTRGHDVLLRQARWALVVPVGLISLAALIGTILGLRSSGPDLLDWTPKVRDLDGYVLVAWRDLERPHDALTVGGIPSGAAARALGYMMSGPQPIPDGRQVGDFCLLPDAGNAVHPAHRFGDQMIDVSLRRGDTVRFAEGSLVWVWGTWRALPGNPKGPNPLYQLENARIEPATRADVSQYYR